MFHESLLHASGTITSGRDRLLVITGWSPCHYQPYHPGFEPDPALLRRVAPDVAALLSEWRCVAVCGSQALGHGVRSHRSQRRR
eukprot:SAG11_NODE_989_length_6272_cov_18.066256_4_plen_84_part_00